MVKHAVAQGVVGYLIKPFTFAGFRAKLDDYAAYRRGWPSSTPCSTRPMSTPC